MKTHRFETLSETLNALQQDGYKADFQAGETDIAVVGSQKKFLPTDLTCVKTYRFDGMTNPSDESEILVLEAKDGTKGTLITSYGSAEGQNPELIKKIPSAKS